MPPSTHHARPLVLHFDVNKTVILTDSMDSKSMDVCVREAISDLFWGQGSADNQSWEWLGPGTVGSSKPANSPALCMTYHDFCKKTIKDKDTRKVAVRNFSKADEDGQRSMEKMAHQALTIMEIPEDLRDDKSVAQVGLMNGRYLILPALFKLIAALVQHRIKFSLIFRSFGKDHEKIRTEWNAFCERKHPVFSYLLEGVGALNGSEPGVPDKRLERIHTMYRDKKGALLALDTMTNGPESATWDSWVKQKPKPQEDTRNGRDFFMQSGATCVDGLPAIQKYFEQQLEAEATAAIKDDWAWWTWHDEACDTGKLVVTMDTADVIFFDDNIGLSKSHIVDVRSAAGSFLEGDTAQKLLVKVNPVEALLNDDFFIEEVSRKLSWPDFSYQLRQEAFFSKELQIADAGHVGYPPAEEDEEAAWPTSFFGFFACCNGSSSRQRCPGGPGRPVF